VILPIYVADHCLWNAVHADYTMRSEDISFDPIPTRSIEKPSGNRIEISRGDHPRFWVKTPAMATIREAPGWHPDTMGSEHKTKANPYGFTLYPCKTLYLSGETISGKVAWVVLSAARRGDPDYAFVEAPKEVGMSTDDEHSPEPGPIRGLIHDKPIVEMSDDECDEEIAALDIAIAASRAKGRDKWALKPIAKSSDLPGQLLFF